jgi:hypothetical protein
MVVRAKDKLVIPPPYMRNTTEVPITVAEYGGRNPFPRRKGFSSTAIGVQTIMMQLRRLLD